MANSGRTYQRVQGFLDYARRNRVEFVGCDGESYSWRKASNAELVAEMRDSAWIDDDDSPADVLHAVNFLR